MTSTIFLQENMERYTKNENLKVMSSVTSFEFHQQLFEY